MDIVLVDSAYVLPLKFSDLLIIPLIGFAFPIIWQFTAFEELSFKIPFSAEFMLYEKTTLFRDLILEKFGDPAKGLLVGLGAEVGYSILDNLNATQIEDWDDLEELKEWLITKKGKEHDIQIVAFDVIDELMPMAEDQVIKMSRRETGKPCKSFNAAFGGYSEPRKRLMGLVKGFFTDLKKAGIMPFAISHTKIKSIKEKGEEGEGYHLLTSNLSNGK